MIRLNDTIVDRFNEPNCQLGSLRGLHPARRGGELGSLRFIAVNYTRRFIAVMRFWPPWAPSDPMFGHQSPVIVRFVDAYLGHVGRLNFFDFKISFVLGAPSNFLNS
jgi:hypothetical protein